MSESFDQQLGKALKEQTSQSLGDWSFSPDMQKRVRERVQAIEVGGTERKPARWEAARRLAVGPGTWVAVAAAALFLVLKTQFGPMGSASKMSDKMSHASAPMEQSDENSGTTAYKPQPDPKTESYTGSKSALPPVSDNATGQSGATTMVPKDGTVGGAPAVGAASAKSAWSAAPYQGALTFESDTAMNLGSRASNGFSFQANDAKGVRVLWDRFLEGVNDRSAIAAAVDGRIAVSAGRRVYMVSPQGAIQESLTLGQEATGLAWSADGRLAVAEGDAVEVYRGGTVQFRVPAGNRTEISFDHDVTLGILSDQSGLRQVSLYDGHGNRTAQFAAGTGARGIAFGRDGKLVIAGGKALTPLGSPVWEASGEAMGLASPSYDRLVAWDSHHVVGVRMVDGNAAWQLSWNGPGQGIRTATASTDGSGVAVVARIDMGTAVWVIDGEGKVLFSGRTETALHSVALEGGRLALLSDQGLRVIQLGK